MKFEYRAKDKDGVLKEGEVDAYSKDSAVLILQEEGFYVISVKEKKVPFYKKEIKWLQRVPDEEAMLFPEQMAVMLESGISVVESLRIVSSQLSNNFFKEVVMNVSQNVEKGNNLSTSMSKHPKVFSEFYINMIRAGESIGELNKSFRYLAEYQRANYEFKKKIIGALTYPMVILFVFIIILLFLFLTIMPSMIEIVEEMGDLPLVTQIAIGISDTLRYHGWFIFVGLFAAVTFIIKFFDTSLGRNIKDRAIFKLPVLGDFFKKFYLHRFAETFSTLFSAGVSVTESLEVTKNVIGNKVYANIVQETKEGVERGEQISNMLKKYPYYFPYMVIQMMAVGERTGKTSETLQSVIRIYKKQLEERMDRYVNLIEPTMIIFLGVLVGGLVASIILPVYQMGMTF